MLDDIMKAIAESLLSGLCSKYEDAFLKVSSKSDVIAELPAKKIDVVSIKAMLCDCGMNATNACILFHHLNQYFGKRFFESEHK
jgi:hypothetical protein